MDTQAHAFATTRDSLEEIDWEAIYRQELPRIYNYFRYRVGQTDLAEDLTAITFEKAWRGRWRYRRKLAAFSTWLFTITRHVAIDHFRRVHGESSLAELPQLADPTVVEDAVQQEDDQDRLSSLLAKLPTRERDLIALKYGAQLSNRAIARLTRLSESNVGTIPNRVVHRLHEEWEVEGEH